MRLLSDVEVKTPKNFSSLILLSSCGDGGDTGGHWPLIRPGPMISIPLFNVNQCREPILAYVAILRNTSAMWTFWDESLTKIRLSHKDWESQPETTHWPGQMVLQVCHQVPGFSWFLRLHSETLRVLPPTELFGSCNVNHHTANKKSTLPELNYLISHFPLWGRHYSFPHLTNGKT